MKVSLKLFVYQKSMDNRLSASDSFQNQGQTRCQDMGGVLAIGNLLHVSIIHHKSGFFIKAQV